MHMTSSNKLHSNWQYGNSCDTASGQPDGSPSSVITVGGFSFEDGKHAMFSYQWDSQAEVISVREYFASLGIPTWMVSGSTVLVVMA